MKRLFLILLILYLIIASCNDSKTKDNISISDMFLVLPDSLAGTLNEKKLMLEGGKTLDNIKMGYDTKKYPKGLAVVKGKHLHLHLKEDGIWEMAYFDNKTSDNEKLILINSIISETHFLYAYKFFVNEKRFEKTTTNLSSIPSEDVINKSYFTQEELISRRNVYNCGRQSFDSPAVLYNLSESNHNKVKLSATPIFWIARGGTKGFEQKFFPEITYHWDGASFEKETKLNEDISTKDFYASHTRDIIKLWKEEYSEENIPPKYALIDIDKDGCEELYLRNKKKECGMLFCFGEKKYQ